MDRKSKTQLMILYRVNKLMENKITPIPAHILTRLLPAKSHLIRFVYCSIALKGNEVSHITATITVICLVLTTACNLFKFKHY